MIIQLIILLLASIFVNLLVLIATYWPKFMPKDREVLFENLKAISKTIRETTHLK